VKLVGITTQQADRRGGIIATLSDGYVLHAIGSRREALRTIAAECDRRDVSVRTLSTPQSIFRDLQGSREELDRDGGASHSRWPEASLLGYIGRTDLGPRAA
jgi:hypothetical protein